MSEPEIDEDDQVADLPNGLGAAAVLAAEEGRWTGVAAQDGRGGRCGDGESQQVVLRLGIRGSIPPPGSLRLCAE